MGSWRRWVVDSARKLSGISKRAIAALPMALPVLCLHASAQTTTISGTVYDPRTTASALPLPNVLVYATTGTVAPLPAGVQCLTASAPTEATSYTNTAVDGTFTLTGVPENATYTLVIQAGKWRRQFTETVAAAPLTGLALHMPSDHTQGDIPMIAIATGQVDALECVLLNMGISATEFTDDNETVNPGGHIHLYEGSKAAGADINASTPSESVLMSTPATLNNYDVVMFPCQGSADGQATVAGATNLLNYANAGGRVFGTHFSYAWLDPNPPYNSLFPAVADWVQDQDLDDGEATINTGFNDGAILAQWLLNIGASTSYGQVSLTTLRHDISGVVAPTQSWATLNSNRDIMQFTFNAPVGAAAASQCGRVLFNEYHVEDIPSATGLVFPAECPASTIPMTAQEEMLEFALFDLSTFVTPVVVPSLSITFDPSPLIVKQGDTADSVTVNATNTSTSNPIDGTAVLTFALPAGLTATGLTDSTGGWICTVGTLTCTRTTGIATGGSDSVTLTVSVPAYPPGGLPSPTGLLSATVSSPNFSSNVTASDKVVFQQPPPITWATPAPIVYGTPLSGAQLDATSTLAGAFTYSPDAGAVLAVGQQTLQTTFTPADTTDYTTGTASVTLTVKPATPVLTLSGTPNPAFVLNPVTFTATLSAFAIAPTGTVDFWDGTAPLGSGNVANGSATITATSLTAGPHSISAVYSGDASYNPATSGTLAENLVDFTLAPTPGGDSVTTQIGGQANYTLVVTPVGGTTLPGAISLSVTGLPLNVAAAFSPPSIAANSTTTTVTLQLGPPAHSALEPLRGPVRGTYFPAALALILLPFAGRLRKASRRWRGLVLLALAGLAMAAGVSGCGSVSLYPKNFPLTVTASSGALSHTTTLTLTVE